jgi:hypothetical protein
MRVWIKLVGTGLTTAVWNVLYSSQIINVGAASNDLSILKVIIPKLLKNSQMINVGVGLNDLNILKVITRKL